MKTSETSVAQLYTPSLNTSVTTRDGRIDKVTVWKTGVPGSTRVVAEVPASLRR